MTARDRRVSQRASARDDGAVTQIAGDVVHGDQVNVYYSARVGRSAGQSTAELKRQLRNSVRAQESTNRAHLLGLDIVRPVAARETYAVEHTSRFHEPGTASVHTDILEFFRATADCRLVILGPSGAGKSVLAVQLILALITGGRAEDPVPVRFDLASWEPVIDIGEWLVAQLVSRHGVAAAGARTLLHEREILPVLDGLDEISLERDDLDNAVQAMNAFLAERIETGFVVTCRNNVYSDIGRRVEPSSEITILPLTVDEVVGFIEDSAVGDRLSLTAWEPVLTALRAGSAPVLTALSTPWRMTLAVTYFLDRGDTRELVPRDGEADDDYLNRAVGLLVSAFAPARARLHNMVGGQEAGVWCAFIAEELDQQVSRGAPRQDIIAHYSADRAWAAELLNRVMAVGVRLVGVGLLASVLAVITWLVDVVVGMSLVTRVRSGLEVAARSPVAYLAATAVGVVILAYLMAVIPRARKETRRLLRRPGLPRRQEIGATILASLVGLASVAMTFVMGVVLFGAIPFLIAWPIAGAGVAWRIGLVFALVQTMPLSVASGLQNAEKYIFEVWYGRFLTSRRNERSDMSLRALREKGVSGNWVVPSAAVDKAVGTPAIRCNWPAAIESFLVAGYAAGIFRRSGEVYQFRHRQLQDWYARPVDPLRAWDNELPLPQSEDSQMDRIRATNQVAAREGRAAAQRLVIRRETKDRNAQLREHVESLGNVLRPPGVLAYCYRDLLSAFLDAEVEARLMGSAVVQPWHLFIAILDQLARQRPPCPADVGHIREMFRPVRTLSWDESPGHLPLARSLRTVLINSLVTRNQFLRLEFVAQDLLDAGDDAAHRAVQALRYPVDTETAVRTWLADRIAEIATTRGADDAAELPLLAEVVENILDRPAAAQHIRGLAAQTRR